VIWALLFLGQVPFAGLDADRKAFEGFRQCVLAAARLEYPTGQSLKVIFEKALKACEVERLDANIAIQVNEADRAMKGTAGPYRSDIDERLDLLHQELLFDVADDFVPKAK